MGHQRAGAAAAAALILTLTACGGSDGDSEPAAVLDIAREQVEDAEVAAQAEDPGLAATAEASDDDTRDESDAPAELPDPDPSTYKGSNRVVNLWVGADGATSTIDVWGRRTFTNGPILLAEGVPFGSASDYFSSPPGYSLVIVGAGAGADGEERAGIINASDGEQITTVFTNGDDAGSVSAPNVFERGTERAPAPPADGAGLVVLFAPNVRAFSDSLTESIGGDAFYVGDDSSVCRTQRIEATGAAPAVLGGTQQVELELPPGPTAISLHPWFSPDECDQPAALDVDVDVVASATALVLIYSPDGSSIESLILPVAP